VTEGEGKLVAGRYRLRDPLGHGGMGVVWRAWDEYLQRYVAIKEIHVRGVVAVRESDPAVRRALREARAAAALRHPGIVTVHDVVTDDGRPWIVMELIEGRSLAELLEAEGPITEDRAARMAIQVLGALDAAHQRGILHRDVKPGNIMLDGERVVLTDFSIAAIDGATALTGTDQLIGSPEYIAPERIDGHEATAAADLWGLGVTLYSAMVGHSPFHRTDTPATLAAIVARDPEPHPRTGRLWPVIDGLLRKDPAGRLTASAAMTQLTALAGPSVPIPRIGPIATLAPGDETRVENHASQVTIVPDTVPNTRTAPPLFPPPPASASAETEPVVRAGDVTAQAVIVRPRRNRARIVWTTVIVVTQLALAATIIWLPNWSSRPAGGSSGQKTSTVPLPPMVVYSEPLGFSIDVPRGWERNASGVSDLSDVVWQAKQTDPKLGVLKVQVQRDTTKNGVTASSYLTDKDLQESTNRGNIDYTRVRLENLPPPNGGGSAAELEYATAQGSNLHFRFQTRAYVTESKKLFVLTLSLYAADEGALRTQWDALQPIRDKICDSFRLY
jgi:serine/threonine protein kinase